MTNWAIRVVTMAFAADTIAHFLVWGTQPIDMSDLSWDFLYDDLLRWRYWFACGLFLAVMWSIAWVLRGRREDFLTKASGVISVAAAEVLTCVSFWRGSAGDFYRPWISFRAYLWAHLILWTIFFVPGVWLSGQKWVQRFLGIDVLRSRMRW